jgi:hypothetical protein
MAEFFGETFREAPRRGERQIGVNVLCAAGKIYTPARGTFAAASQALAGWDAIVPSTPSAPLDYETMLVLARATRRRFGWRGGALLIVGFGLMTRVSELCSILVENVVLPGAEAGGRLLDAGEAAVYVPDSKTGLHQLVTTSDTFVIQTLRHLVAGRRRGDLLADVGASGFAARWRAIVAEAGLGAIGYTPHSLRHGGSLHRRWGPAGESFEQVMEGGRWRCRESLLGYLQTGRAQAIVQTLPAGIRRAGRELRAGLAAVLRC